MNKEKLISFCEQPKIKKASEMLYTVVFCLFYYDVCSELLVVVRLPFWNYIRNAVFFVLPFVIVFQWVTHNDRKRDIIFSAFMIILFKVCFSICPNSKVNEIQYKYFALLAAGSVGADYKKILKKSSAILGIAIVATLIETSITGGNLVFAGGGRIRSGGGLGVVTDAASLVLFLCIYIFIIADYETDLYAFLLAGVSCLTAKFYFDSNTSFIISLLLMLSIMYSRLEVKYQQKKLVKAFSVVVNILSLVAVPVLTVGISVAGYYYGHDSGLMHWLDLALHKRIRVAWSTISTYPVTFFGNDVDMVGAANVFYSGEYTHVDISFLNILVKFGVIVTFVILILWLCIVYKAMSGRKRRLVLASILIAVHSVEEQHFFELLYNPIVWMPFAYGINNRFASYRTYCSRKKDKFEKKNVLSYGVILALSLLLVLMMPRILMRFRTIYDITSGFLIELAAIVFLFSSFALIYIVGQYVRKRTNQRAAAIAGLVLGMAAIWLISGVYLNKITPKYIEMIESDRKAIETILEAKQYPVYSDNYSEFYYKTYNGFSISPFTGDDMVRQLDCTVITKGGTYSNPLFGVGALFSQISDNIAVYTTDKAVAEALASAGYSVKGYYYLSKDVSFIYQYSSESTALIDKKNFIRAKLIYSKEDLSELDLNDDEVVAEVKVISADKEEVNESIYFKDLKESDDYDFSYEFETLQDHVTVQISLVYGEKIKLKDCTIASNSGNIEIPLSMELISKDNGIYSGNYEFTTTLCLEDYENVPSSDVIATISIVGNLKNSEVTKKILASDFELGCSQNVVMAFSSGSEYFKFKVIPNEKYNISFDNCSYTMTPSYDAHYFYNDKGYAERIEYYDLDGNKMLMPKGYFAIEYDYDKDNNITRTSYYDCDNKLVISSEGYAEKHTVYNKLKQVTYESYFGDDGQIMTINGGYSAVSYERDSFGNALVTKYYDSEGNPVVLSQGYAEVHRDFDSDNRIVYESFYGADGEKIDMPQGYSACRYDYDDAGNISVIIYLDDEDEPIMTTYGYAEVHREYDDQKRIIVESYFGTAGELMETEAGYAVVVNEYDEDGNNVAVRYFGIDTSEGYVEIQREFDKDGRIIYEAKVNSDGERLILAGEYHAYRKTYDENGNIGTIIYYGLDGEILMIGGEYAEVHYEYDDKNRVIKESYFDGYGTKVIRNAGNHSVEYGYDADGNLSDIKYYDVEGKPMIISSGIHEIIRTFNSNKNLIREEYYDIYGEPVMCTSGYSVLERDYDESGGVISERKYDLDGNLVQ